MRLAGVFSAVAVVASASCAVGNYRLARGDDLSFDGAGDPGSDGDPAANGDDESDGDVGNLDCASDLVGWWKLDETTGLVAYDSAADNDGALINTPGSAWLPTGGHVGGALALDGVDDSVSVADVAALDMGTRDWSQAVWFYYQGTDGGAVVGKNEGWVGYTIGVSWEESAFCRFSNSVAAGFDVYAQSAAGAIGTDRWHHAVCTYDRDGNLTLYVDAAVVDTVPIASQAGQDISNDLALSFGTRPQQTEFDFITGLIDDVRLYDRVLSASEVALLHAGSAACDP